MRVAVHQPHYLPWLGYFDKMDKVDCFVFLDTVQFEKGGWQNRNRIKTPGGVQWLTVPVHAPLGTVLRDVRVVGRGWGTKHLHALATSYSRAPFFRDFRAFLEETLVVREWSLLVELCIHTTTYLACRLGITTKSVTASSLGIHESDPNARLARVCQVLGATTYLAGTGGKGYMDLRVFEERGIEVEFQEFSHPVYSQLFGGFVGNLSALDLLCNCGTRSLEIIRHGEEGPPGAGECHSWRSGDLREDATGETWAKEEARG